MPVPQISPQALAEQLAGDPGRRPVLLDVRTPEEHALARLPDSVLIPLGELQERADELDALRGKPVVVYCHHGVRSLSGAAFLLEQGLEASSLSGGIDLWSKQVDPAIPRY